MNEINIVKKEIEIFREEIDKVDNQIIELLNLRCKIAQKIGKLKKNLDIEIFQPQRETNIIQRMKRKSILLNNIQIETLWKEIINACRLLQEN